MVVIYEDADLLVVDKPQGLATTPGVGPSFCGRVFAERPGLVRVAGYHPGEGGLLNRLDNDTGGLVLFAKTDDAFRRYTLLLEQGLVEKRYRADVLGVPAERSGVIDWPVGHHHKRKDRMVVLKKIYKQDEPKPYRGQPQPCETRWKVLDIHDGWSRLEVTITKGVRHQIRVHLAAVGHPILGDRIYGPKTWPEGIPVPDCQSLWAVGLKIPGTDDDPISIDLNLNKAYTV